MKSHLAQIPIPSEFTPTEQLNSIHPMKFYALLEVKNALKIGSRNTTNWTAMKKYLLPLLMETLINSESTLMVLLPWLRIRTKPWSVKLAAKIVLMITLRNIFKDNTLSMSLKSTDNLLPTTFIKMVLSLTATELLSARLEVNNALITKLLLKWPKLLSLLKVVKEPILFTKVEE